MGSIHRNGILRRPIDNHSGILRRSNDVTRIITSMLLELSLDSLLESHFKTFQLPRLACLPAFCPPSMQPLSMAVDRRALPNLSHLNLVQMKTNLLELIAQEIVQR
ncbi:uncharacterized protein LOC131249983 isoform X2 [Magnolia sinica]|uniref:uncharacterized protein LOC131249983 isoform X2 n=1 Tax=Magnolia sinica TaxID=86752 RepID=UPI00265A666C|nr:uncharacterized protein LOC131249983 isoform X2 [Magnolia sinica]